jgi:hypothetical protein
MNTKLDALFLALACIAAMALPVSFQILKTYAANNEKNCKKTQIQRDTIPLVMACKPISAMAWCDSDDQVLKTFF